MNLEIFAPLVEFQNIGLLRRQKRLELQLYIFASYYFKLLANMLYLMTSL